jgi:hypothetical protein
MIEEARICSKPPSWRSSPSPDIEAIRDLLNECGDFETARREGSESRSHFISSWRFAGGQRPNKSWVSSASSVRVTVPNPNTIPSLNTSRGVRMLKYNLGR